jgi:hypothetical protein
MLGIPRPRKNPTRLFPEILAGSRLLLVSKAGW